MTTKTKYCYDCEVELNSENTKEFDGFDESNYYASRSVGFNCGTDMFTKCDDCFNGDIDRALENPYNI